jgi:ribulose kinase
MLPERLYLGIDVGTASVRAALFDASGAMRGMGTHPIRVERPREDFVEQSSDDIWSACGMVVRAALEQAKASAESVAGVGFDATCSLAALDAHDRPVTVSPTGDDTWNVVVWMDHRATALAARINETKHEVLRYVGGVVSPEMETPKLLWLKENLPQTWRRAARFLDLPDFLVYRATGSPSPSSTPTPAASEPSAPPSMAPRRRSRRSSRAWRSSAAPRAATWPSRESPASSPACGARTSRP